MTPAEIQYYQSLRTMFLSEDYSLDDILTLINQKQGDPFAYSRLNHINCTQAYPFTLFDELLVSVKSTKQFSKLKELQRQLNVPYSQEMVLLIQKHHPTEGLKYLIRLYGSAHLIDSRIKEPLIQTLVKIGWLEGLDYLLNQDSTLVNVALCTWDNVKKKLHSVDFLLNYAMSRQCDAPIIQRILDAKPNIRLRNKDGNTQLHLLANNAEKSNRYLEVLIWFFEQSILEDLNTPNEAGGTPITNAMRSRNKVFLELCKKMYQEKHQALDENQLKYENMSGFNAAKATKAAVLSFRFRGDHPILKPFEMFATLIGKGKKTKLFLNIDILTSYVDFLLQKKEKNFLVNAVLMTAGGVHALNVVLTRVDAGPVMALLIDSTAGDHAPELPSQLAAAGIQVLRTMDKFQHTNIGCHIFASYLSGKLANITLEEFEQLHQKFYNLQNGRINLHDLPLKFGVLGVTQSLKQIKNSYEARIVSHPMEAYSVVNAKHQENFTELMKRGITWQYQGFVGIEQVPINNTLSRKTQNRHKHALNFLEMNGGDQFHAIADLLCMKELDPQWEYHLDSLLESNPSFSTLDSYQIPCNMLKYK